MGVRSLLSLSLFLVSTVSSFNITTFRRIMFEHHNFLRSLHDAPPLSVDISLETSAMAWARHLGKIANDKCLYHSQAEHVLSSGPEQMVRIIGGENIYFIWSTSEVSEEELARNAMKAFYEGGEGLSSPLLFSLQEIKYYNYNRPQLQLRAAHFTNLVWKSVEKMGVGLYMGSYTNRHGACNVVATKERPATGYMVVVHESPAGNVMTSEEFESNVLRPNRVFNF